VAASCTKPDERESESGISAATLKASFYPMGFPVELETNSRAVMAAARELWGRFRALSDASAVRFRVTVEDCDARVAPKPLTRAEGHIVSIIHGPDNFAVCDVACSYGYAFLTRDTVGNRPWLQYHFLEAAIYTMLDAASLAPVHAACIEIDGRATLLCGDSGAGKTSLAYACAKRGWTFISGDATHMVRARADRTVVGRPFALRLRETAAGLFPELRQRLASIRPNGKVDYEIDTSSCNFQVTVESKAACVVFLNRQENPGNPRIEPFSRHEAMRQFTRVLSCGDERILSEQNKTLARLLELPVVQLTYGNPADAEGALRGLLSCGN
jgi:hypothetical protein